MISEKALTESTHKHHCAGGDLQDRAGFYSSDFLPYRDGARWFSDPLTDRPSRQSRAESVRPLTNAFYNLGGRRLRDAAEPRRQPARTLIFGATSLGSPLRQFSDRGILGIWARARLHFAAPSARTARNSASVGAASNAVLAPGLLNNRVIAATKPKVLLHLIARRTNHENQAYVRDVLHQSRLPAPGTAQPREQSAPPLSFARAAGRRLPRYRLERPSTRSKMSRKKRSGSFTPGCFAMSRMNARSADSREFAARSSTTTSGRAMSSVEDSTFTTEGSPLRAETSLRRETSASLT